MIDSQYISVQEVTYITELCAILNSLKDYFYYRTYDDGTEKGSHGMAITPDGITLEFKNGKFLDTGIVPSKIYPDRKKLTPKEIYEFHKYIIYKDFKIGQLYSKREYNKIKKAYQEYLKLNPK